MRALSRIQADQTASGDEVEVLRNMVRFAEEAEQTPLESLLESLPTLAQESSQKLEIAARVMEQRLAALPAPDRDTITRLGQQIIQQSDEKLARRLQIILS